MNTKTSLPRPTPAPFHIASAKIASPCAPLPFSEFERVLLWESIPLTALVSASNHPWPPFPSINHSPTGRPARPMIQLCLLLPAIHLSIRSITPLLTQMIRKRQQRNRDQLKMLHGKGNTDDRDKKEQPEHQVDQGDFPSKKDEPDDIQQHGDDISSGLPRNRFLAKWHHHTHPKLNRRETHRDPNNRKTQGDPADNMNQSGDKPAEDKPDNIAKKTHRYDLMHLTQLDLSRGSF